MKVIEFNDFVFQSSFITKHFIGSIFYCDIPLPQTPLKRKTDTCPLPGFFARGGLSGLICLSWWPDMGEEKTIKSNLQDKITRYH